MIQVLNLLMLCKILEDSILITTYFIVLHPYMYFAGYIGCVCSYMCNFFQGVKVDPKNAEGMGGLVWADQRATLTGG